VVDLLAEVEGRPVSEVMAELVVSEPDLLIDSLRVVEILTRVEERYGVSLPADPVIARSTRSVLSFAQAVVETINGGDSA
jgi:acyl carrier protein